MIDNNLEGTISKFLLDNEYFDSARNRALVRSGFLNCRDSIIGFLQSLVVEANKRENLTETQLAAVATYISLIEQLKSYGAWIYVDNESNTESSTDSVYSSSSETSPTTTTGT